MDIYKDGYSKKIIITKNNPPKGYKYLVQLGIEYPRYYELKNYIINKSGVEDNAFIVINEVSTNTYEEASIINNYMKNNNFGSVIVVTSRSHTRRASLIFKDVLEDNIKFIIRPSKYDEFGKNTDELGNYWKEIIFEYQKILFYSATKLFSLNYPNSN